MARILQRLINRVHKSAGNPDKYIPPRKPKRPKSIYEPQAYTLPRPSLLPARYPRSILLDEPPETSVITNSRIYAPHKRLPPHVTLPRKAQLRAGATEAPREMTKVERRWWANPYCMWIIHALSKARLNPILPEVNSLDLLIRITSLRLPSSGEGASVNCTLVPDGLQHTKFTARKGGKAAYVLCLREAVDAFAVSGKYRRTFRESNITVSSNLSEQVAHLLRLRVLQELDLLGDHLTITMRNKRINGGSIPLVRRLTREEMESVKSTRLAPFENAVAIIEVPPEDETSLRNSGLKPSMSPLPPSSDERSPLPEGTPAPPLSILLPSGPHLRSSSTDEPSLSPSSPLLPQSQVPLYNALTAFPFASQRLAMYDLLDRILALKKGPATIRSSTSNPRSVSGPSDESADHCAGYLLCADSENVKMGDMAAVAVALWRLRMFEGGGWKHSKPQWLLGTSIDVQSLL